LSSYIQNLAPYLELVLRLGVECELKKLTKILKELRNFKESSNVLWNMKKEKILKFCEEKHRNQKRKGGEPYINHLIESADIREIANELSDKYPYLYEEIDDVYIAALLHDTIEDTNTDYEDILELTNQKITSWVTSLSNDKRLPSEIRRFLYYKVIQNACIEIKILKLVDIYSNLNGLNGKEDDTFIKQFTKKVKMTLESLKPELEGTRYFNECNNLIDKWKSAF